MQLPLSSTCGMSADKWAMSAICCWQCRPQHHHTWWAWYLPWHGHHIDCNPIIITKLCQSWDTHKCANQNTVIRPANVPTVAVNLLVCQDNVRHFHLLDGIGERANLLTKQKTVWMIRKRPWRPSQTTGLSQNQKERKCKKRVVPPESSRHVDMPLPCMICWDPNRNSNAGESYHLVLCLAHLWMNEWRPELWQLCRSKHNEFF